MFDYSSFNSKRWDWANVENLSEPNLWIIKTFPCLFLQSPFFLRSLYSETYWHILLLSWFWWWGRLWQNRQRRKFPSFVRGTINLVVGPPDTPTRSQTINPTTNFETLQKSLIYWSLGTTAVEIHWSIVIFNLRNIVCHSCHALKLFH